MAQPIPCINDPEHGDSAFLLIARDERTGMEPGTTTGYCPSCWAVTIMEWAAAFADAMDGTLPDGDADADAELRVAGAELLAGQPTDAELAEHDAGLDTDQREPCPGCGAELRAPAGHDPLKQGCPLCTWHPEHNPDGAHPDADGAPKSNGTGPPKQKRTPRTEAATAPTSAND